MTQVTAEYPVVSAPTSPSPPSTPPDATPAKDSAAIDLDGPDTVEWAAATPDAAQPHADLGLTDDEYERIRQILGRRPTRSELAMYSIMWSEHCSYKSSKLHLRQFEQKAPEGTAVAGRVLAGIGENAGVIRISEQLAVTFKVESHNHPSFVEPYQGAATGVGGIVRDILAMGARPVAVMDPLRFGAATHEDTARVLPGVVAGIGGYGNCLGLPNIGGEVVFDPCYQGNPLVNALCIGVMPVGRLQQKGAVGPGNVVVLIGAKTGRDGIGGVSVLASATFDDASAQRRPSVQVGDPFTEKLLIEACLELYEGALIAGVQDLGGAGLTCALSEMSAAAGTGMLVDLERVPLREPSMEPHEVLASESQERMLLVVERGKLDAVLAVCAKWGVLATAIGYVTAPPGGGPGRLVVNWHGQSVVDVPPGSLADDGPVYARPMREPNDRWLLRADRAETLPRPRDGEELRETLLRMAASPNLCDKSWVTEQYDRYVLGNTVLAQPEDAGVLRIEGAGGLGVALSMDGNGRFARLDPYQGAKLALAEAYRNVAMTGATPVAVTDCLNFGSPEDPAVMWQFAEAVRGLADGCQELGLPVTGGNVSFYNQTGTVAINPTPVVGVLGILENVSGRVPMAFHNPGDLIFLLGETRDELSGSEWAHATHGHLGGVPPVVDLPAEQRLAGLIGQAARSGLVNSAHDLSDGGLAQALVEACLRLGHGAEVTLIEDSSAFTQLFSESAGRALVSVRRGQEAAFTTLATERGVACAPLGVVRPRGASLTVVDQFDVPMRELWEAHSATLPALFGAGEVVQVIEEPRAPEPVEAVLIEAAPVESPPADPAPPAEAAPAEPVEPEAVDRPAAAVVPEPPVPAPPAPPPVPPVPAPPAPAPPAGGPQTDPLAALSPPKRQVPTPVPPRPQVGPPKTAGPPKTPIGEAAPLPPAPPAPAPVPPSLPPRPQVGPPKTAGPPPPAPAPTPPPVPPSGGAALAAEPAPEVPPLPSRRATPREPLPDGPGEPPAAEPE